MCRIMCMYVYLYIHIIFGDVLCLLSQSISPLVNQPNKIFQIYEKTVQDSSSVKLHFRQLPSVIIRSFFLGFYWFPNPALCKVWGSFNAPAPLRGVYRCHRHRALIFHLWTSQRLSNEPTKRRWVQLEDFFNITSPFIVRKQLTLACCLFLFSGRFDSTGKFRKYTYIHVYICIYIYTICNIYHIDSHFSSSIVKGFLSKLAFFLKFSKPIKTSLTQLTME